MPEVVDNSAEHEGLEDTDDKMRFYPFLHAQQKYDAVRNLIEPILSIIDKAQSIAVFFKLFEGCRFQFAEVDNEEIDQSAIERAVDDDGE